MVTLQEQQARRGRRTDRDKDRERYRSKAKPKPITAAQSENFLWQLLAFEEEMRDEQRSPREIWELFGEAVREQPAAAHLHMLKQSAQGAEVYPAAQGRKGSGSR